MNDNELYKMIGHDNYLLLPRTLKDYLELRVIIVCGADGFLHCSHQHYAVPVDEFPDSKVGEHGVLRNSINYHIGSIHNGEFIVELSPIWD